MYGIGKTKLIPTRAGRARRACGEDVRQGEILAASVKQEPSVSAVLPLSRIPLPSGSGGRQSHNAAFPLAKDKCASLYLEKQ
jgi:hypothetical protein